MGRRTQRLTAWTTILGLAGALAAPAWAADAPAPAPAPPVKLAKDIPDCPAPDADVCRNAIPFGVDQAQARLATAPLAYWIDGDTLNIVARAEGDALRLSGTLQEGMQPLTQGPGPRLWAKSFTLPRLDQSMLSIRVRPMPDGAEPLAYRGPKAPEAPPAAARLAVRVEVLPVESLALGATRKLSIYTPAALPPAGGYPVVYMTDGQSLDEYAPIVDALIAARRIRPVLLVGLWSGVDPADKTPWGLRGREYIKSLDDPAAFARHEAFVLDEVLPLAQRRYHASARPDQRLLFGYSNGADWALWAATTHPDKFRQVAAFSIPSMSPLDFSRAAGVSLHLEAGRYEAPFLRGARRVCDQAKAAGVGCELHEYYAGHASDAWQYEFAQILQRVFPAEAATRRPSAAVGPRERRRSGRPSGR